MGGSGTGEGRREGGGGPVAGHLRLCDDGPTPGIGGRGGRERVAIVCK
jgi:hypothetical protein